MTPEEREQVVEQIDYLKKMLIESKDIEEFEDYLFYRNEIGSTLIEISNTINNEFGGNE